MRTRTDQNTSRRLALRFDLFFVAGLVLIGAVFYLWQRSGASSGAVYAEIIVSGVTQDRFDLAQDRIFTIETLPGVYFEIRDGAVAFIQSDCPIQICVGRGFISRPGQSAVCLPKRSVLIIVSPDGVEEIDVILR